MRSKKRSFEAVEAYWANEGKERGRQMHALKRRKRMGVDQLLAASVLMNVIMATILLAHTFQMVSPQ